RGAYMTSLLIDNATPRLYQTSLPDALPIDKNVVMIPGVWGFQGAQRYGAAQGRLTAINGKANKYRCRGTICDSGNRQIATQVARSEEHTSELQSRENVVCRLLLEDRKRYLD